MVRSLASYTPADTPDDSVKAWYALMQDSAGLPLGTAACQPLYDCAIALGVVAGTSLGHAPYPAMRVSEGCFHRGLCVARKSRRPHKVELDQTDGLSVAASGCLHWPRSEHMTALADFATQTKSDDAQTMLRLTSQLQEIVTTVLGDECGLHPAGTLLCLMDTRT